MNDQRLEETAGCLLLAVWSIALGFSLAILLGLYLLLYGGAKLMGLVS